MNLFNIVNKICQHKKSLVFLSSYSSYILRRPWKYEDICLLILSYLVNSNQLGDFIKSFGSSQNILIWTLNTFTFLWQKFAGLVCLPANWIQIVSTLTENKISFCLRYKNRLIFASTYQKKRWLYIGKSLFWKKKTLTILVLVHHLFPAIDKR